MEWEERLLHHSIWLQTSSATGAPLNITFACPFLVKNVAAVTTARTKAKKKNVGQNPSSTTVDATLLAFFRLWDRFVLTNGICTTHPLPVLSPFPPHSSVRRLCSSFSLPFPECPPLPPSFPLPPLFSVCRLNLCPIQGKGLHRFRQTKKPGAEPRNANGIPIRHLDGQCKTCVNYTRVQCCPSRVENSAYTAFRCARAKRIPECI